MGKSKEKAMIAAAVAVTAILCVYGMYMIVTKEEPRQDLYVMVSEGIEDEVALRLKDFGLYAKVNIHITGVPNPNMSMLNDADVIIIAEDNIGGSLPKLKSGSSGVILHAYYNPGSQGMAGSFINWLESQWLVL